MAYRDDAEDECTTLMDEKKQERSIDGRCLSPRAVKLLTTCNIVFFAATLALYASSWVQQSTSRKLNPVLRQLHAYSPLLDTVDLSWEVKTLNGTLYPNTHPSVARGPPSAEKDAVWNEWEIARVYAITADQIRAMGKDPSTAAKLEDEIYGLGDDAYAATLDIYHQLHCLDMLRMLIYPSRYPLARAQFTAAADPHAMWEMHMDHCVDMLMQALQCSGNLGLVTMHWVAEEPVPFPDMSVRRMCVADFEGLTEWRGRRQVDLETYVKIKKPEGVKELPQADAWYRYFRPDRVNPNHAGGANPDVEFNV